MKSNSGLRAVTMTSGRLGQHDTPRVRLGREARHPRTSIARRFERDQTKERDPPPYFHRPLGGSSLSLPVRGRRNPVALARAARHNSNPMTTPDAPVGT